MNAIDTIQPAGAAIATQDKRRVAAALDALAPNSRKQYGSAWNRFAAWSEENDRPGLPCDPETLTDYLVFRHAQGVSPATLKIDRAAVCKVHAVHNLDSPGADSLVKDTMRTLSREGRDRGRGQAQGIGWTAAEAAASIASNGGSDVAGLRDSAIIRTASDTLARISEIAALQVSDIEADTEGGTVTIRAGKTDQTGEGDTRYIGAPTVHALRRWMDAAAIESGPLFRRIRKGGQVQNAALSAEAVRAVIRKRAADVDSITGKVSGHSFRVGSAQDLARHGASIAELQQAGGWKSAAMPGHYVRREAAARGPVARRRYGIGE